MFELDKKELGISLKNKKRKKKKLPGPQKRKKIMHSLNQIK